LWIQIKVFHKIDNKDLTKCFFTANLVQQTSYKCNFCEKSIKYCSGGYRNFINHIESRHTDHEELYKNWKQEQNGRIIEFVSDKSKKRAEEINHWMKIVIVEDQCCDIVEKTFMRENSKFEPISVETLMNYNRKLSDRVRDKIKERLPTKFGLAFDGVKAGDDSFVAVFAVLPKETLLLAVNHLPDPSNKNAKNHADYISNVLSQYDRELDNVCFLVGDNTPTNPAIAELLHKPFIGCYSHRFNLALENVLEFPAYQDLIKKIELMTNWLRNTNNIEVIKQVSGLKPLDFICTRWTSKFTMIERYRILRPHINRDNFTDIPRTFELTAAELDLLDELFPKLREANDISTALQKSTLTLRQAKAYFKRVNVLFRA
jgi:hypothetical protein